MDDHPTENRSVSDSGSAFTLEQAADPQMFDGFADDRGERLRIPAQLRARLRGVEAKIHTQGAQGLRRNVLERNHPVDGAGAQAQHAPCGERKTQSQLARIQETMPDYEKYQAFLKDRQIGTSIYYPLPLHLQPCFAYLGYKEGSCPESERAAREVLSLPIYPELTTSQLDEVIEGVRAYYGR